MIRYSQEELFALLELGEKYSISYRSPQGFEEMYFQMTGVRRSHGCLYMAYWRLRLGYYDYYLYGGGLIGQMELFQR